MLGSTKPRPETGILLGAALALLVSSPVSAQFTISDGNASFSWTPAAVIGANIVDFTASHPCPLDNMGSWGWSYSVPGSHSSEVIDDFGHGSYNSFVLADTAVQTIGDVDTTGLFNAEVLDFVQSSGPDSGYVEHLLIVQNIAPDPISLKIYCHWDVNLNWTPFNDQVLPASGSDRILFDDGSSCGGFFECHAVAPDHWGISPFVMFGPHDNNVPEWIRSGWDLFDSQFQPTVITDIVCAFQWNVTIGPGESRSFLTTSGHNHQYVGSEGTAQNVGTAVGGAFGAPTVSSPRPVIGQDLELTVDFAGPATIATLLFGAGSPPATLPNCGGFTVGFPIVLAAVPIGLSSGSGSLVLPGSMLGDLTSAQVPFLWQAFAADPTSPACFPLSHSDVLVTTFGD